MDFKKLRKSASDLFDWAVAGAIFAIGLGASHFIGLWGIVVAAAIGFAYITNAYLQNVRHQREIEDRKEQAEVEKYEAQRRSWGMRWFWNGHADDPDHNDPDDK